jgi:hypothetical protein
MSTPLLVVLPFCKKDVDLAAQIIRWMAEINTPKAAAILLASDDEIASERVIEMAREAKTTFNFVKAMMVPVTEGGWPPNKMFLQVAYQIQDQYRWPFFWMEPDCVPLVPDWLEQLENVYGDCPKRFMGPLITQDKQPDLPKVHLTGCSIYPPDCYGIIENFQSVRSGQDAWDIGCAEAVVPKSADTKLIQHYWGLPELPPVFVKARDADSPKNFLTLDFIKPEAVIFHRDKTHSLLPLLRSSFLPDPQIECGTIVEKPSTPLPAEIEVP